MHKVFYSDEFCDFCGLYFAYVKTPGGFACKCCEPDYLNYKLINNNHEEVIKYVD